MKNAYEKKSPTLSFLTIFNRIIQFLTILYRTYPISICTLSHSSNFPRNRSPRPPGLPAARSPPVQARVHITWHSPSITVDFLPFTKAPGRLLSLLGHKRISLSICCCIFVPFSKRAFFQAFDTAPLSPSTG
jgi:hypothetical protein